MNRTVHCIPQVNWTCETSDTTIVQAFTYFAPPFVLQALSRDLSLLPSHSKGSGTEVPQCTLPLHLILSSGEMRQGCLEADSSIASTNACLEQRYHMVISSSSVTITGSSLLGLHFGICTLRQLVFTGTMANGQIELPIGEIKDCPSFAQRGVMLDVSRGKIPSLSYLKQLVSFLSDLKYTVLQLYCEDKLALSRHPRIGVLGGCYTKSEIEELDSWCRRCFIELQPNLQTYSHMHGILRLPEYASLSENDTLFSFAAGSEAVYEFLDDEFAEVLPWFSSRTLNINMDEAYDIGTGFSAVDVERFGKGEVFIRHIKKVVELARRHGAKTIQIWGDIVGKYIDLVPELPDDVILIDWNYNPSETYPSIYAFSGLGREFWAAPGVSSWNSLFPRVYNSYTNIRHFAVDAQAAGACGYLVTDWGDYGHYQSLGLSLYGYMYGAEHAFNAGSTSDTDFEAASSSYFFSCSGQEQAFHTLMDSNLAQGIQTGFKTMSAYAFFDDLLKGLSLSGNDKYPAVTKEAFLHLKQCGDLALSLLEHPYSALWSSSFGCFPEWKEILGDTFYEELRLSALMTSYTGDKGLLAYDMRSHFCSGKVIVEDLLEFIFQIKLLHKRFVSIRGVFERCWLARAKEDGWEGTLFLFDKASVQLSQTVVWLSEQIYRLKRGEQFDSELTTYTAGDAYTTLWTSDFSNMWDRAYPWQ